MVGFIPDLPQLQTIISGGSSFYSPHTVTLVGSVCVFMAMQIFLISKM